MIQYRAAVLYCNSLDLTLALSHELPPHAVSLIHHTLGKFLRGHSGKRDDEGVSTSERGRGAVLTTLIEMPVGIVIGRPLLDGVSMKGV